MILGAGLMLLGLDSTFFNLYGVFAARARLTVDQYGSVTAGTSTASSIITLIHWTLILLGIVLTTRGKS